MSRSKRDCVSVVEEELVAAGASYRLVINKHYKFWVLSGGREHLYVCSGTAGAQCRAEKNTRAGIRRLLRQLGLIAPDHQPGISSPDQLRKGARHE